MFKTDESGCRRKLFQERAVVLNVLFPLSGHVFSSKHKELCRIPKTYAEENSRGRSIWKVSVAVGGGGGEMVISVLYL